VKFYNLSDEEYIDIVTAYIDFTDNYSLNTDSCPFWNTIFAKDYNEYLKPSNTSE
jgi:hypothetical protein